MSTHVLTGRFAVKKGREDAFASAWEAVALHAELDAPGTGTARLLQSTDDPSQFVGKNNVRVNTVSPGPIYFEGGAWEMIKGTQPKFYDWAIRQIPCGRMGSPEEIARVIPFVIGIAIVFARDAAGISRFGILAYATFVWLRGRAQTTLAGWRWEIGVSIAGAAIGVCVGVWLLFFSSSGWLDANQKRVVGAAVFVDAGVALATTECAGWAAHDENLDKRKKC